MKKCPNCGKPVQWQHNPFRPFCSERCKLVDLSKWVDEEYRVPGKPVTAEQPDEDDSGSDSGNLEFKL